MSWIMFYPEQCSRALSFCRVKVQQQNQRLLQEGHVIPPVLQRSNIWIATGLRATPQHNTAYDTTGAGFESADSQQQHHQQPYYPSPVVRAGERPALVWLPMPQRLYNKDQLVNAMPLYHPVPIAHDMATQRKMSDKVNELLAVVKANRNFSSNWWVSGPALKSLGLTMQNNGNTKVNTIISQKQQSVYHVSQLVNGTEILQIPFSRFGTPLRAEVVVQDLLRRNASCGLYISDREIAYLGFPLKPTAKGVTLELPVNTTSGKSSSSSSKFEHYYNVDDVKFPDSFALSPEVIARESSAPATPLDGISGEQLLVDALVNRPNIQRHLWFTTKQLLTVGARCGVNAVPVVVESVKKGTQLTYFHVDDFQDPEAVLTKSRSIS